MFYEPVNFAFTADLEHQWQIIRQELEQLASNHFLPWKETFLYETGWDVFGIYAFGQRVHENCGLCPETTRIVEAIPGLITAAFSSLKPQTHIKPHVGYHYNYVDGELTRMELNSTVLRCHLGLIVPPTYTPFGCAIRIGDELRNWQEGQCLVFDDTVEHEAWNRSQGTRVVLLIDFKKSVPKNAASPLSNSGQYHSSS